MPSNTVQQAIRSIEYERKEGSLEGRRDEESRGPTIVPRGIKPSEIKYIVPQSMEMKALGITINSNL